MATYQYIKSKKRYLIQDGYFKYSLTLFPSITCQCIVLNSNKSITYCSHIENILRTEYNLSDFAIKYLHLVYDSHKTVFENRDIKNIKNINIDKMIMNKLNKEECGFCMMSLTNNTHDTDLYECNFCKKLVHKKCNIKWIASKNTSCIYCRQEPK